MTQDLQTLEPGIRVALREAADQVHAEPDDWDAVQPPLRRHSALRVAALVAALVASSVVAFELLVPDESSTVNVPARRAREVEPDDLRSKDADLEVFMQVRARDLDISEVRMAVETSSNVKRFAFLDQEAAFVEFQRIFADKPDLVKNIDAASLPTSFRLVLRPHASKRLTALELGALFGVDEAQIMGQRERPPSMTELDDGADLEVFMQVHATSSAIQGMRWWLEGRTPSDFDRIVFFDQEEALDRFKAEFRGDPDQLRGITSEMFPMSFRVFLRPDAVRQDLRRAIEGFGGVDTVVVLKNR
jgi:cell division protein FtsX